MNYNSPSTYPNSYLSLHIAGLAPFANYGVENWILEIYYKGS